GRYPQIPTFLPVLYQFFLLPPDKSSDDFSPVPLPNKSKYPETDPAPKVFEMQLPHFLFRSKLQQPSESPLSGIVPDTPGLPALMLPYPHQLSGSSRRLPLPPGRPSSEDHPPGSDSLLPAQYSSETKFL